MDIQKVWELYGERLRQFLLSKTNSPEDAEDLLQEILIKTHYNLPSLADSKKFQSWLYKIARNTLVDYYRKPSSTLTSKTLADLTDLRSEYLGQQKDIRQELTKCFQPFINCLPTIYREAIETIDLNGVSQKAMAEELGLSHSAIKSRVQRGRRMLAELFQACCSYELDMRGNIIDYKPKSKRCLPAQIPLK